MKLLKTYLKPFAALVLACILLLFGQAMCDLTLPNLMSDIVNTGIQLGGVDEAAPAVLNQQAVDLLTLFMNDAEAGTFKNAYTPVEHGSDEETKLAKTYENIKDMDAVALSEDADVQAVGDAYGKAAYAFMTFLKDYGAQTGQAVDTESGVQDMDMRQLYAVIPMLQQMPKETFSEAIDSAENAQSMIGSQVGATFTKLFYKELGVDLDAKQVHYIVIKGLEMLGIALLGVLAAVLVGFFASRISSGVAKQMRSDVFRKVESFSNTEFDKFSTAHDERRDAGADAYFHGSAFDVLRADHGRGRHYFRAAKKRFAKLDHRARGHRFAGACRRTFKRCNAEIQELAAFDGQIKPRQPREFERHACGTRVYE